MVGLLLVAVFALACGGEPPRRVILVTVGSLSSDALGASGDVPSRMPRLLEQASAGARFDNFYSATPLPEASLASMLTGRHPWEHRVLGSRPLRSDVPTVAEDLSKRGFSTVAVVSGSERLRDLGLLRGFDDVREVSAGDGASRLLFAAVTDTALRGLAPAAPQRPAPGRFVWVHYGGLELSDASGDPKHWSGYEAAVMALDDELARLFTGIDASAGALETHVVLASAGGAGLGGGGAPDRRMRPTERDVEVPLVILSPRVRATERHDVAGSIDISHTLLALAGVKYPTGPWTQGRNLAAWAPDPTIDPQATSAIRAAALGMLAASTSPAAEACQRAGPT